MLLLEVLLYCSLMMLNLRPAFGGCPSTGVQVMQMFDKAEAEYRELSEKKRIVENDKEKIRKVSAPLRAMVIVLSSGQGWCC